MSGTTRRRRFDAQFKLDAVRLIQESDRSISDIANDLGVRRELLYKWKRELEEDPQHAFPGKGKLKPEQDQLRQLQQELKRVTEERDILKKALAFFSRNAR
jgi:transposase